MKFSQLLDQFQDFVQRDEENQLKREELASKEKMMCALQVQIRELESALNQLTRELHDKETHFINLKTENERLRQESGQSLQSVVESLEEEI